jgi:hypothetical protein
VRVFKTKVFARFARRARIDDRSICEAVHRAAAGLIDADLGAGLIKQRIARSGRGRSGGFRVIVIWRRKDRSIFVHGLAKNERDSIDDKDLASLKDLAALFLTYDSKKLNRAVVEGELVEVSCHDKES